MPSWRPDRRALPAPRLLLAALAALGLGGPALGQAAPLDCAGGAVPPMALALAAEVNLARADPAGYARLIADHFAALQGRRYPLAGAMMVMREGRPAVDEAIAALRAQPPLPPLSVSACLSVAAQGHADRQGRAGGFGHRGAGGDDPSDRVAREVRGQPYCGENISYGLEDARTAVIHLIVDDGVPGRGHRQTIFDPRYRSLGAGFGPHATMRAMSVQVFCLNEVRGG